ncbi:MAG: 4Fe-4S dicluster domain-containing protein [Thermoguttaceae bacterium]|nr:4Fe-4S dicluster domain-containing protein [Thermoguttaceae bacterium]
MQNKPSPRSAQAGRRLRWARVAVAAVVLTVLTLFFLDFAGFIPSQAVWLAKLQLIPSILAGAFGVFAALVVLTLILGRVYCSVVCPLGVFQDVLAFFGRFFKSFAAKPRKIRREYRWIPNPLKCRAGFLVLAVATLPLGLPLFALLEPYGIFGRIAASVLKPIYVLGNNALEAIVKTIDQDNYTFYYVDPRPETWGAFAVGVVSFAILLVFAGRYGRLYCNSVCPVGTILGALSKFSFLKIRLDAEKCVGCGLCAKACKSSCVDVENRRVDASRCVVCFDCLTVCRMNALSFAANRRGQVAPNAVDAPKTAAKSDARPLDALLSPRESERVRREIAAFDRSKRDFIALGVAATTIGVARSVFGADKAPVADLVKLPESLDSATSSAPESAETSELDKPADYGQTPFKREHPIAPPGAVSFERFNKRCVGCHLCVAKCPQKVLKPATFEYGLRGFMQPRVVFSLEHFCNFDCVVCGEVCPAGAILPLKIEEKHLTQMGRVVFIKENCVVYARNENCGACSEHCPTQAVKMVPYGDPEVGLTIPETNVDLCVGCGACESICPALPYLAIYIDGNPAQLQAKPVPKEEVQEVELNDFGF